MDSLVMDAWSCPYMAYDGNVWSVQMLTCVLCVTMVTNIHYVINSQD